MAETTYVQNDDGTKRKVTDPAEIAQLYAGIVAGDLESDVESDPPFNSKRIILNTANAVARRQVDAQAAAANAAAQAIKDDRTVVVVIDDGVMLPTEERVELQGPPSVADKATVKARMVAQRGIANPNHVTVETLADFKAGQL